MRKFFKVLVLVPLAVILLVFAIANRRPVTVSFDPFSLTNPSIAATLPLFVVIILVAIFGVVAGSMATWLRNRHWRREARRHEEDAREARAELALMQERERAAAAVSTPALPFRDSTALPGDNRAALL